MKCKIQANVGTWDNPQQVDADYILYTGIGGTPNMDIFLKNVPPIKANFFPEELQIKSFNDNYFIKSNAYDYKKFFTNDIKYPIFRLYSIYDGVDYIYNPKISYAEKVFSIAVEFISQGLSTIKLELNDNFYLYSAIGDYLLIKNNIYEINDIFLSQDTIIVSLKTSLQDNLYPGDVVINLDKNLQYLDATTIDRDNNYTSPQKFKFVNVNDLDNERYLLSLISGYSISNSEFTYLYSNDYSKFLDIYDYIKEAIFIPDKPTISNTYSLNQSVGILDKQIYLNTVAGINIGDYITLEDINKNIEIVKVKSVNTSDNSIIVDRAQFIDNKLNFDAGTTSLYLHNIIYFNLFYIPIKNIRSIALNSGIILKYA